MRSFLQKSVFLFGIFCIALPATAQIPLPVFFVPVVAKNPGLYDSDWATDFFLSNIGEDDRVFSAHFFKANQANTFNGVFAKKNVSVKKGATLFAADVIGQWFPSQGSDVTGWLFVADTTPVNCNDENRVLAEAIVSTRMYNKRHDGSSFGMIFESSLLAINTSPLPSVFTGIRNNGDAKPGMRTNVGVANISTSEITVEIKLFGGIGGPRGTAVKKVKPLSLKQWSLTKLGFSVFAAYPGRLEVRLVDPNFNPCGGTSDACYDVCDPDCSGRYGFSNTKAFIAYVSNTENISGDGETILPVVDQLGVYEWANDYMETHCPDKMEGSTLLSHTYRQLEPYIDGRHRPPPIFRKVIE